MLTFERRSLAGQQLVPFAQECPRAFAGPRAARRQTVATSSADSARRSGSQPLVDAVVTEREQRSEHGTAVERQPAADPLRRIVRRGVSFERVTHHADIGRGGRENDLIVVIGKRERNEGFRAPFPEVTRRRASSRC